MRTLFFYFTLLFIVSCQSPQNDKKIDSNSKNNFAAPKWSVENERRHNRNRNDSTQWSKKTWNADINNMSQSGVPILEGIFPVPDYELVDNGFEGLGNGGEWEGLKLKDKTLIYHSFYVTKKDLDKGNEVYFTIVALTDFVDRERFTHTYVYNSSRNHPHYTGQGFIKTQNSKIEFVSFTTADENAYALVNMRLFDLRIGNVVLIAPKKDGTFRSLQLEAPSFSSEEMKTHIESMVMDNRTVIDFFTAEDNI